MLENVQFIHPWFFLLLLLIPLGIYYAKFFHQQTRVTVRMPDLRALNGRHTWRIRLRLLLPVMRMFAFTMLIIAMARPQATLKEEKIKAEAVDISLVLDVSSSMLSEDFEPNRLEASKGVAAEFINKRPHDCIGLTVFAGEAYS